MASIVPGHPELHRETLSPKQNKTKNKKTPANNISACLDHSGVERVKESTHDAENMPVFEHWGIVTRYKELSKQLQVRDGQGQAGETQARRKGARKWRAALQGLEPGRG